MDKNFSFGENWKAFSENITEENYKEAKKSVTELIPRIKDRTFLDIGCGSGLFSIALSSLGAKRVVGVDVDPVCVEVSKKNLAKFKIADPDIKPEIVEFKVKSILNNADELGVFDVVYSWGVLHHTGNMYKAFNNAASLVKDGGALIISIYNRHFTSYPWKIIKKLYNISPGIIKKLMIVLFYPIIFLAKIVLMKKNPFYVRRGMSFYYDLVDWIGGYPYEYASIKEVCGYFEARGFKTVNVIPTYGFTGCNEFVFERVKK